MHNKLHECWWSGNFGESLDIAVHRSQELYPPLQSFLGVTLVLDDSPKNDCMGGYKNLEFLHVDTFHISQNSYM